MRDVVFLSGIVHRKREIPPWGGWSWLGGRTVITSPVYPKISFDHKALKPVTVAQRRFVLGLVADSVRTEQADERRQRDRFRMVTSVPAIAVDEECRPIGEPFMLMTRDISTTGIALVHTEPIDAKRVVVEMTGAAGECIQIAIEILRSRRVGDFYEIGGRYVAKLVAADE